MVYTPKESPRLLSIEIFIGCICFLVFASAMILGGLEGIESKSQDLRFQLRGRFAPAGPADPNRILIVGITTEDIQAIGPLPWDREVFARLLDKLMLFGAKSVAMDILFNEAGGRIESDQKLAEAIKRGRVILPSVFVPKKILDQESYQLLEMVVREEPAPLFREAAKGIGFIDVEHDLLNADGVVRQFVLRKRFNNQWVPSLDLAHALVDLGQPPDGDFPWLNNYQEADLFEHREDGTFAFFLWRSVENLIINFRGKQGWFDRIPVHKVLNLRDDDPQGRAIFAGCRVYVGADEIRGVRDIKMTPLGRMSGVEIHCHALDTFLNQRWIYRPGLGATSLYLFIMSLLVGWLLRAVNNPLVNILLALFPLIYFGLAQFLFNQWHWLIPFTPVVLMIWIQATATRLTQDYRALRESNRQLDAKYRELSLIHEVSQSVTFMEDLDKTLNSILDKAIRVLNAERGSIMLYDPLPDRLMVRVKRGKFKFETAGQGLKPGEGIAGWVFTQMKGILSPGGVEDENFVIKQELDRDIQSLICVPLMVEQKSIGVLNMVNREGTGSFQGDDLHLATTLANQAAVLIQNAKLYNLATIDGLTSLYVRRHFQFKLTEEMSRARRYDKPMAIMMTDIDHFKKFNDTYGHQTGDFVLREVAMLLKESIRNLDTAARYGGEEFVVVLPETDREGAVFVAERFRQRVEKADFLHEEKVLKVTVSIGVSTLQASGATEEKGFIEKTDIALYACKKGGRNCVTFYDPQLETEDALKRKEKK